MLGWKSKLALVAAVLGVAAWTGYRSERRGMDAAGKPATTFRSVVRHVMAPKSRTEMIDRLNALRHTAGRSQPTPQEVKQCWEIIRGFTVEDVQAYLAEIPDGLKRPVNQVLISMLFYRWAQMDPEAAMNAATQLPHAENRDMLYIVAVPWMQRDVEGAMRWAKASKSGYVKSVIGNDVGRMMVMQDPETALARAKAEFPDAERAVVHNLFEQLRGSKESRRKLFEIFASIKDPQLKSRCLGELTRSFNGGDRDEALAVVAEVEESGLLSEQQVETFRREVSFYAMRDRPQERLEWLMRPESNAQAETQLNAYSNWAASNPAEAIEWAKKNDKIDFLGETVKRMTYAQIRAGWQPTDDSRQHWEDTTHRQFNSWQAYQPEAAGAWLQTLPGDIREIFTSTSDHATH
jgi:hypothetical protein